MLRRSVLPAASATVVLASLALASAGAARVEVPATHRSTPPPRAYSVDVVLGTIGGLGLHAPANDYVRSLGIPDFVGQLEASGTVELLWSRSADPLTGWAVARLRSPTTPTVEEMRFGGLFRTARGDRRGTTLAVFLRHWRAAGPRVVGVRSPRGGREYNVVVGRVVFGFDAAKRLQAVGLGAASLCVIPNLCVAPRSG